MDMGGGGCTFNYIIFIPIRRTEIPFNSNQKYFVQTFKRRNERKKRKWKKNGLENKNEEFSIYVCVVFHEIYEFYSYKNRKDIHGISCVCVKYSFSMLWSFACLDTYICCCCCWCCFFSFCVFSPVASFILPFMAYQHHFIHFACWMAEKFKSLRKYWSGKISEHAWWTLYWVENYTRFNNISNCGV